ILCMTVFVSITRVHMCFIIFFFSSRRRHTRSKRDWSSDVCSSDLASPMVKYCGLAGMWCGPFDGDAVGCHDLLAFLSVNFTDTLADKENVNQGPHAESTKREQHP